MKLIGLADIHGAAENIHGIFSREPDIDLVLLLGDITDFGGRRQAAHVVDTILEYCPSILAVPGNCDLPEVGMYLSDTGRNLHGSGTCISDIVFIGAGYSLPCPGTTPGEVSEHDFRLSLENAHTAVRQTSPVLLVTHEPPYNTACDIAFTGEHVGSREIRAFIESHRPSACLCGHIHEGCGTDVIETTLVANPGPLRSGGYVYAEIDGIRQVIEIRHCTRKKIFC